MWIVYKHTAPNGKVYIGITSQSYNKRWRSGKGYKHNNHFYRAISEFGWENFKHEILLENLTEQEAQRKEIELIEQYKSNNRDYGYNIERGGLLHDTTSEETKQKLSIANKGKFVGEKHPMYGKHHSEYTREIISEKTRIAMQNLSEEQKQKMIESGKRNKGKRKPPLTEEHRRNISLAKIGKGAISVTQINKNTGERIIYSSAKEAQDKTGISRAHIASVCKGYRKTAGGYLWQYT